MVFPNPYPSPPHPQVFSPMPDPPKEDDTMAQWTKATGYVQPEPVDGINFDLVNLDALFAWEQASALPEQNPSFQLGGDLVSIFLHTIKEFINICHRVSTGVR